MEFIAGLEMSKEESALLDRLVKSIFNTLFTKSTHGLCIKLRQAHQHQICTSWEIQILNKWANDPWRFKVETSFEASIFNAEKDKDLPWFCQQKDRLTTLYPELAEFMIHRKVLRQCGGDLDNSVKIRTTEQSSAEDILNILVELTTRTRTVSSRLNLKTRFNIPWKDSVDKNPKQNSNNMKYKSSYVIIKCHFLPEHHTFG
ncbi:hypothetical protein O181_012374 [Austropuccinia psidii MF-1]|uniref:Uncharacterized protein n=1 Tax=Austropuccinia psidii MF-1 TaxID=1389203 RepID=A0A9Q3GMT6_9BASI|nr:hypothetical protein [Austropuccinia psidii MF-1]